MEITVTESIQKTLDALPDDSGEFVIVHVPKGIYNERVEIKRNNLALIGEGAENTIITEGYYAAEIMENQERRGPFRSYTMYIEGSNVMLAGLTVRNTAAPRKKVEQAIALYEAGDGFVAYSCRFEGYQDTLFTGPLPEKELLAGGFTGPGLFKERLRTRQLYKSCYICGDVDFIFGSATAYFEDCDIEAKCSELKEPDSNGNLCLGYITAASTYKDTAYGYVFEGCRIYSDLPKKSIYLGRPWRNFAKTVFLNCEMSAVIKDEGFHDWNKAEAHETVYYGEYNCKGPGAAGKRADFVKKITSQEYPQFDKYRVLCKKGENN